MQWFILAGFATGMRTMTPIAVVCWFVWLGLLPETTWGTWAGATVCMVVFTLAALSEYVADVLPQTPSRLTAFPLIARMTMGAIVGLLTTHAFDEPPAGGVLFGVVGALLGAYVGYHARTWVSRKVGRDLPVGLGESALALALALLALWQMHGDWIGERANHVTGM